MELLQFYCYHMRQFCMLFHPDYELKCDFSFDMDEKYSPCHKDIETSLFYSTPSIPSGKQDQFFPNAQMNSFYKLRIKAQE